MSQRRTILGGLGIALLGVAATWFATMPLGTANGQATMTSAAFVPVGSAGRSLALGQYAPELLDADGQRALLTGLDGGPVLLADYRGRFVWIVFWATWCIPCQEEAPAIRDAARAYGADVTVLAIDEREPTAAVREFARAHELDYPIGLDPTGAAMALFRAPGLPAHYFLNRDGVLVARDAGQLTEARMNAELAALTGS